MILFQTERLIVRRMTAADAQSLFRVYGDAEAMRLVGDGQPLLMADCERWVKVTARNYVQYGYGMSTVLDRQTRSVIGFCGIVHPGGQTEPELKYALLRTVWGRGLATEVARGMIQYVAETFGLLRIIATVNPAHRASQRVLIKTGMRSDAQRHNEDKTTTYVFVWEASHDD